MKLLLATVLLIVIVLSSLLIDTTMADSIDCGKRCGERCSKAGVKDRCLKYCGICCKDCNCVPSGTYGNKQECPCYMEKKNSKGHSKCP
ncbi:hypothetical protein ACS0TY_025372 [Phlomoides rotata]